MDLDVHFISSVNVHLATSMDIHFVTSVNSHFVSSMDVHFVTSVNSHFVATENIYFTFILSHLWTFILSHWWLAHIYFNSTVEHFFYQNCAYLFHLWISIGKFYHYFTYSKFQVFLMTKKYISHFIFSMSICDKVILWVLTYCVSQN